MIGALLTLAIVLPPYLVTTSYLICVHCFLICVSPLSIRFHMLFRHQTPITSTFLSLFLFCFVCSLTCCCWPALVMVSSTIHRHYIILTSSYPSTSQHPSLAPPLSTFMFFLRMIIFPRWYSLLLLSSLFAPRHTHLSPKLLTFSDRHLLPSCSHYSSCSTLLSSLSCC